MRTYFRVAIKVAITQNIWRYNPGNPALKKCSGRREMVLESCLNIAACFKVLCALNFDVVYNMYEVCSKSIRTDHGI